MKKIKVSIQENNNLGLKKEYQFGITTPGDSMVRNTNKKQIPQEPNDDTEVNDISSGIRRIAPLPEEQKITEVILEDHVEEKIRENAFPDLSDPKDVPFGRKQTQPINKKTNAFLDVDASMYNLFEKKEQKKNIRFVLKEKIENDTEPTGNNEPNETDQKALKIINNDPNILKTPGIKDLIEMGFIPIVKGSQNTRIFSAELGRGAQGAVYEVTKGGKRYAAKVSIIGGRDPEQEYEVRQRIEQIREQLPEEVSKHIVKSFYIGSSKDEKCFIYVMEALRPLTSIEKKVSFHDKSSIETPSSLKQYFNDHSHLLQVMKTAIEKSYYLERQQERYPNHNLIEEFLDATENGIANIVSHFDLSSLLKNFEKNYSYKHMSNSKLENISSFFAEVWFQEVIRNSHFLSVMKEDLTRRMAEGIEIEIFNDIKGRVMDPFHTTEKFEVSAVEHIKNLMFALRYLDKHFKIKWSDLHEANIMARPGTGEFVAADIGLFELPKAKPVNIRQASTDRFPSLKVKEKR